jgi:Na+-transporting methylmalonyl-CoA/oxaloacetate decarboxylase gamma subunit
MPRLRMVAKVFCTLFALIIVIKIMNAAPPPAPPQPEPVPEVVEPPAEEIAETPPPPPPTEEELMEMTMQNAKKEQWIWKDFTTYVLHVPCRVMLGALTGADLTQ